MVDDLKHAFSFFLEDKLWKKKMFTASAVAIVPIINIASLGYLIEFFRNVLEKRPDKRVLPPWENFGELFFKGLVLALATLIYGAVFSILMFLLGMGSSVTTLGSAISGGEAPSTSFTMIIASFLCVYGLSCILWAAGVFYSETLQVKAVFRLSELFTRMAGLGRDYFLLMLVWTVGILLMNFIFGFIPYVGFPLTIIFSYMFGIGIAYQTAVLDRISFSPVVADPVMDKARDSEIDYDDEDEYGYKKKRKRKASDVMDGYDEVLTWSTSSDEAE